MKRLLSLLCAAALLGAAGCERRAGSPRPPGPGGKKASSAAIEVSLIVPDPCALVLVPHAGGTKLDEEILHVQRQIGEAPQRGTLVEKLGWLFVQKARSSFDSGFYKLAEQCAVCLESKEPGTLDAMLLRGHALQNLHRFKDAEPLARELMAQRGSPFDCGLLGDVLMEQGKLQEAIDTYQKMADLSPDPRAYTRIAHVRWLRGDVDGAIEMMRLAAQSASPADPESGAWTLSRLALYQWQAGDSDKARQSCETALGLRKDYPPALLVHGRMLLADGKSIEALAPLRRAVELTPLPEYLWALIEALRLADQHKEAEETEARLKRFGAAEDPRTFALYLATRGEQKELALQLAERELQERADVHTHDALAWAFASVGQWEEARQQSQLALAEGTRDARFFLHAGVVAARLQRAEDAARFLDRAGHLEHTLLPSERRQLKEARQNLAELIHRSLPAQTASTAHRVP
jgi:tetratricopeptide (TPR) repeat protein